MVSLTSALDWYHKKIGAYDKELWEKSVDQRILRGVCAIPKKSTRIKTELIDVDLVRGSAFVKAKPQHSWTAATISGIRRVIFLPFFYSWWKLQTNTLVSCTLVILYFLQIGAAYFYLSADEKEFQDVSATEILTPFAMAFLLGMVHSQIVATFTSKKATKPVTRDKRRRFKAKKLKKPFNYERESKSSPDSASEDKPDNFDPVANESILNEPSNSVIESVNCANCPRNHAYNSKRFYKKEQHLRFSFEDNSNVGCSSPESGVEEAQESSAPITTSPTIPSTNHYHSILSKFEDPIKNGLTNQQDTVSSIPLSIGGKCCGEGSSPSNQSDSANISVSGNSTNQLVAEEKSSNEGIASTNSKDSARYSSDEEFFIARKTSYTKDQWKNRTMEMRNKCTGSKYQPLTAPNPLKSRRFSDGGPTIKKPFSFDSLFLSLRDHRHSTESISVNDDLSPKFTRAALLNVNLKEPVCETGSVRLRNVKRNHQEAFPPSIQLPVNIKNFSSSCESGADTSPNTPSKPQTSDLEWPIITNTDCNSDSSDCSSHRSDDEISDISPTENPFAWEIQEPSKKLSNVGYNGSDKVSCTIWEHNECKKADLTALDISSAIIQKVDSSQHSSEYLYVGVVFAAILSFLPLLFRLRNGVSTYIISDITTDVLTLNVPDDVVKVTDGLLDVMLGSGLRVKLVVWVVMVERFTLSLAYFFLLSVAEKTFKQRFLYAKHFCYLTSSRRAKRSDLPHFRLNKVKNIKIWLSIRSYMKKLGPQRSVDVIVSIAFILEVCVVSLLCIHLLKESGQFADKLHCWELLFWTLALGFFLLRFMVIGTKINKKYRNLSVLITEQINLYLHMEQKPHKKEELILANNVLKLAADLLKELESPFKISGLCANSYLYNITKVVVLSAFSAVLTDVLGFKLKLYKIKLK